MENTKRISLAFALAASLALAACDRKEAQGEGAAAEDKLAGAFDGKLKDCAAAAQALSVWVGRPYAEASAVLQPTGPVTSIRVIRPGTMVTKDYRVDRLNVDLDEKDLVMKIYCG